MKWLILSDSKTNLDSFSSLIKNTFSDSDVLSFLYEDFEKNYDGTSVTHALIIGNASFSGFFYTALGFILGQGGCIFTNSPDVAKLCESLEEGAVQFFEELSEVNSFIKEKSAEIISDFEAQEAYSWLFENGYPFDADNLCRLIENPKWKKSVCERYLKAGLSVNSRNSDGTPLLNAAARADNLAAVKWLCSNGADVMAVSSDRGYSALMDAVWRGNEDITKYLVSKGSDLNLISKEGQTMLVLAVGADRTEICRILAEHGADPDIADSMGMSAYGYSELFKKKEILSVLEKYHKEQ